MFGFLLAFTYVCFDYAEMVTCGCPEWQTTHRGFSQLSTEVALRRGSTMDTAR